MYYDWDVEFGILNNQYEVMKIFETNYKTSNILPGDNMVLEFKSQWQTY